MSMFFASVSIICAAIVGFVGGALVTARVLRRFNKSLEKLAERTAMKNVLAVGWAYEKIRCLIQDGATVQAIDRFIEDEVQRMETIAHDAGVNDGVTAYREVVAEEESQP